MQSRALFIQDRSTIFHLKDIDPRVLSQTIPDNYIDQRLWLERLRLWLYYNSSISNDLKYWAIRHVLEAKDLSEFQNIADFFRENTDSFNAKWSYRRALKESHIWHETIMHENHEEKIQKKHGIELDHKLSYDPLPLEYEMCGYHFYALDTPRALIEEGVHMHHCVATHIDQVMKRMSFIYSVQKNGERLSTLELEKVDYNLVPFGTLRIGQHCGPCNSIPRIELGKVAIDFKNYINNHLKGSSDYVGTTQK